MVELTLRGSLKANVELLPALSLVFAGRSSGGFFGLLEWGIAYTAVRESAKRKSLWEEKGVDRTVVIDKSDLIVAHEPEGGCQSLG